jgi:hypothetical protein
LVAAQRDWRTDDSGRRSKNVDCRRQNGTMRKRSDKRCRHYSSTRARTDPGCYLLDRLDILSGRSCWNCCGSSARGFGVFVSVKQRTPVIVAVALWATARFPQGSGYRIRCLNFADARFAVLDLAVANENLELPRRSSPYRNCRRSAARSKRGRSGSRPHHSRFARKQSLSPLPAVGTTWRAGHSVSVRRDSV